MKNSKFVILKLASSIINKINFLREYPVYLKKKFNKNIELQYYFILTFVSVICLKFLIDTITIELNFLKAISFIVFIMNIILLIVVMAHFIKFKNPQSKLVIKKFITSEEKFGFEPIELNVIKKEIIDLEEDEEIEDNTNRIISKQHNSINLINFVELIKKTSLFDSAMNNFKVDNFIDTINDKESPLTELRAIQFTIMLYVKEYLQLNLKALKQSQLMVDFNLHFNIRSKGGKQELSSSNWNSFKKNFLDTYENSEFYSQLSKKFEKSIEK